MCWALGAKDHLIAFPNLDSGGYYMLRQQRTSRALNVVHTFTFGNVCFGDMVVAVQ
jgi:hypothetical protein